MNRRQFLKDSVKTAGVLASASVLSKSPHALLLPRFNANRPWALESEVALNGEHYEAEVPDTLDLSDRARLAINGLTRGLDAEHDYEHYFLTLYMKDPPEMWHTGSGDMSCCNPKWCESLPMMRVMSGSDFNVAIEQKMMDAMVGMIDSDGLYSVPPTKDHEAEPWRPAGRSSTCEFGNARMMLSMIAWYERSKDPIWLGRIRKMGQGLSKIAVHKDGYAFFPCMGGVGQEAEEKILKSFDGPVCQGHAIRALARYYEITGDKEALVFAGELTNFTVKPELWSSREHKEWKWIDSAEHGHYQGQPHSYTLALRGILEYAYVANDATLKEFVKDGYEWQRSWGISEIGTFGDHVWGADTEPCLIADMTALAIRLSDYGVGDYWDDVDQYVRNHLTESQLLRADLLEKVSKGSVEYPDAWKKYPGGPEGMQGIADIGVGREGLPWTPSMQQHELKTVAPEKPDTKDVIPRSIGLMAGMIEVTTMPYTIQGGCCSGNGTQAMYYAWHSTVRFKDAVATVNLLLNRVSPWMDVSSYLPYEGKVVLKNKQARRAAIRIPRWVDRAAIQTRVNGKAAATSWIGNYLVVDGLRPKDLIVLDFPIVERTAKYTMAFDRPYTFQFKGNTVVDVSPRDTNPTGYPVYLRDHFQQTQAPMKKVVQYVAPVILNF
jgi:hypothetical protein